ncbi:MAG: hypothetical protein V4710_04375 [Verrucomicrobiota bacterium]
MQTSALIIDGLVILAYFVIVISIGLYKGRGDKTMNAFAIGDRNIPWWAVLASILAAEIRAATFLGAPGEGYALRNFTYAQLAIGTILARIIIAFLFIKPYYDYQVVSIYEFLLVRFGVGSKNAASAVFLVTRALASGTRLYVAAVVLVLGYQMFTGVVLTPMQEVGIYVGAQGGCLDRRDPGHDHVWRAWLFNLHAARSDRGMGRRKPASHRSQGYGVV